MAQVPVGYRKIEGSERRPARGARRISVADPNEKFSFTIRVRRQPNAAPVPGQDYWAANPPGARRFLTRDELLARASAAQPDLEKVTMFVRSQGFEVVETSVARRTIRVSGTVAQANTAFAVDLGRYESAEESYRGREGAIYLPNEVADVVQGVFGLDNRRMARRHGTPPPPGPPGTAPLTPQKVASLYNFPPLKAAGQTIGILEFGGGFAQADLNLHCTQAGIPTPTPTLVSVSGQSTTTYAGGFSNGQLTGNSQEDFEVALDVQIVASIAQGANIVMFFAQFSNDGWIDAVTTAIYETATLNYEPSPPLTALSISWGESEDYWTSSAMASISEAFQDASALGLAIFVATGDFGSNDQNNDGNAHVQYPSSDPWVTACGGTYIANASSTPFTEGTWNDFFGATTGGVSVPLPGAVFPAPGKGFLTTVSGTGFPVPPWQAHLTATLLNGGKIPLTGRGVPDIAGNASPYSGYPIYVYGTPFTENGGTSAVAPLYASLVAILAAQVGWPLGYLNPLLYNIAAGSSGSTVFADIKDGANNELGTNVALPSGAAVVPCPAYVSTKGWDACTGLGRIDGTALLNALVVQEETRPFDPDYPFSFGSGGEWLNYGVPIYEGGGQWNSSPPVPPLLGSQKTGDSIIAGRTNAWNFGNCTYLVGMSDNNAVLAVDNFDTSSGGVGVYGRSRGSTWSIGVAGVAETGCGMYGIAVAPIASGKGIGVAGRAMGGIATEYLPLEEVVGQPIGVLGHSAEGPGVRGHGGVLLKQPQAGVTLPAAVAAPGGVFSSGRLSDQQLDKGRVPLETFSLDSLPQLRLIPSINNTLPVAAQIGDLFLVVPVHSDSVPAASMFVCTAVHSNGAPQWQQVQLGPSLAGGVHVP
jgi:kumamolisin